MNDSEEERIRRLVDECPWYFRLLPRRERMKIATSTKRELRTTIGWRTFCWALFGGFVAISAAPEPYRSLIIATCVAAVAIGLLTMLVLGPSDS